MKKLCSLIIAAVLLVPVLALAADDIDISHSIFSEKNWTYLGSKEYALEEKDGVKVVYRISKYYSLPDKQWYMAEHTIFGEVVLKVYEDEQFEKWVQVEKDGKWYTVNVLYPFIEWDVLKDVSGTITAVVIILKDKNSNEIVRREVKRK